jgi:hypothetical protein
LAAARTWLITTTARAELPVGSRLGSMSRASCQLEIAIGVSRRILELLDELTDRIRTLGRVALVAERCTRVRRV